MGVDDTPLNVLGSAIIPITISGLTFKHKFVIAEKITADATLDLDFLEAKECILNLAKGEIIITNKSVPFLAKSHNTEVCCSKITLVGNVKIPPRSEMEITGRIHSTTEGTWLIEQPLSSKLPIFIARTIVSPQDQAVILRVVNTHVSPVTLYKNSTLAKAELIDQETICSTLEENKEVLTTEKLDKESKHFLYLKTFQRHRRSSFWLCPQYSEIISSTSEDLGHTTVMQHHIKTGNAPPICQQPRRMPLPQWETV